MEEAINLFNSTHTDIHVDFTRPADESTMDQKLNAAVAAGSGAPDVVQVAYQDLNTFVTTGLLQDVTKDATPFAKDFVSWTWSQSTIGGKVYAIPQDIGPMALTYNKALFKKYNVPVPTTWAEYQTAAAALHAADPSVYISALPANGGWFTSLAWQNGAQWFGTSNDAWNVNIDTAPTQKVANYWQGLLDKKIVKVEPDFSPEWNKDLNDGKIATWITAAWGVADLQSAAPDQSGNWAVAPMPEWTSGTPAASNWGGSADSVVKGSSHVAQSVEFIHWLNTDPGSLAILTDPTKGGLFPASLAGQQLAAFRAPNPFFGGQVVNDVFANAAKVVDPNWVWGPTMDQVFSNLSDNIAAATSGKSTLAAAMTSLQKSTVKAVTDKGLSVNK
jgi:multiple sugar transport system substrate-binding protein